MSNAANDQTWIELNDNGAWSWFMDERAIVHRGKLLVGSMRSTTRGRQEGRHLPGWGDCELAVHDIETGSTGRVVLHEELEQDDHDGPALHVLPDGRVLAMYTKHSQERCVYWRISESEDLLSWSPERQMETPGKNGPAYGGDNVTYSNLFQLRAENNRLFNFFRSLAHQQNWMYSNDNAETWHYGGMFLRGHQGYAPYFKYATDGDAVIHFIGTEDHPRKFDNSVYHGFIRDGQIHFSDGRVYGPLSHSKHESGDIWDLTPVFRGDADNVAWVIDLHLDKQGRPVCLFSVQKDGRDMPVGSGGMDHRYHYARWDGERWVQHEIAYAGTRLYACEDDYTGLGAINPQNTDEVFISTDADPRTGQPLCPAGRRSHDLFRGRTDDGGATWQWTQLTAGSEADQLRPIVPIWDDPRTALVWMSGYYLSNTGPWITRVMAMLL